ncbi:MAG: adenylate/guanylate cyclase domain-containing protein [Acidimicrobiales bacterium]
MSAAWDIRYARASDGIDVAYATYGEGSRDVLLVHGFTTHLDFVGDSAWHSYWTRRLGAKFRVIQLDKRGTGLSDRTLGHGSLEDRMRDVVAVMDAAGSATASIVGISEGGPIALTFAATYPERVERLALYGTMARTLWAPDYPAGVAAELGDAFVALVEAEWGSGLVTGTYFLTHAPDAAAGARSMAKFERNACTPQMAGEIMRRNVEIDVRALLPTITAPTLIVHNVGDSLISVDAGRYLAKSIPGAQYIEGDGEYHCTWLTKEFEPLMDQILAFLTDEQIAPQHDRAEQSVRAIATILFTDIVGSTDTAAAMGDEQWSNLLETHNRLVRDATRRFGGTVIKTTGDGALAVFDGPSRAIQAVNDLKVAVAGHGLRLRAGIHTGEVERTADDVAGIGVHIGARVMALADPDEVLTSQTVRDLAAGSGMAFADRGSHVLRGIPGEWPLYAVTAGG